LCARDALGLLPQQIILALTTSPHPRSFLDKCKADLDKVPALQKAEESTGVDKLYLVTGAVVLFMFILYSGFGAGFLVNLMGFVYPAYQSFRAIESPDTKDDTQWLVYWVVYSAFSIVETFSDVVLAWIPFYFSFKIAFLFYCFMPQTEGAKVLYDNFLRDFLKKQESAINTELNKATGKDD